MPSQKYFQRPLIPLSLAGFLGVLSAHFLNPQAAAWVLLGALACACMAVFFRKAHSALLLLAAGSYLVFAGLASRAAGMMPDDIYFWSPRPDIMVAGHWENFPEEERQPPGWKGIVDCERAFWHGQDFPVSGKLLFSLPGPMPAWNPGDQVLVRGKISSFDPPLNPGELDFEDFMAAQGVRARMQGRERGDAVRLQNAPAWSLGQGAGLLRRRLRQGMAETIPSPELALIVSIVYGDRSGLSHRFQETMAAAGLSHILAVSGMNVSLVFAFLLSLARISRLPRRLGILLGAGGVAWFSLVAGNSPPVARAAIMAAGAALGYLSGRRVDPLSGLAMAVLALLAWDPLAGLTASFQLSFAATAAVLAALPSEIKTESWTERLGQWVWQGLRITGAALLGTAPLTLYYFYSLVPAALVTNLLCAPLVTLTTIGGLVAGLLGHNVPGLGWVVGRLTGWGARALMLLAQWSETWPWGRVFLWPGNPWWVLGLYAAALGAGLKKWRWFSLIGLAGLLLIYPALRPAGSESGSTRFTFLALNTGEATLVQIPGQDALLIDTGTEAEFLWRVKPFLASQGINGLQALMLTHWDDDHAGGAAACVAFFRPRLIIHSELPGDEEDLYRKQPWLRQKPAAWKGVQGDRFTLGPDLTIDLFWPPAGQSGEGNLACLAAYVNSRQARVLFTSDSPDRVEQQWLLPTGCLAFKAGHHGSRTSSSMGLLLQSMPQATVIMPGNRNPYGFPNPETWQRLNAFSGWVLNTKQQGAIELTVKAGKIISCRTWR